MNRKNKFDFHGTEIIVVDKDGIHYVAMKPIVEAMGLEWASQYRNIKNHRILSATIVTVTTVGKDGKQREMVCLPMDKLNGWLFTVNAKLYTDHRRDIILKYQMECFDVLYKHFHREEHIPAQAAVLYNPLLTLEDFENAVAVWKEAENAQKFAAGCDKIARNSI